MLTAVGSHFSPYVLHIDITTVEVNSSTFHRIRKIVITLSSESRPFPRCSGNKSSISMISALCSEAKSSIGLPGICPLTSRSGKLGHNFVYPQGAVLAKDVFVSNSPMSLIG